MIGLMDCNNFFVSCERLFRPDLAKKPVLVLSSNDGCAVSRSNEVKELGISMGVPYFEIKDMCEKHDIAVFSSNFALYRDISSRVMQALKEEVEEYEVYSVDEAFFNVDAGVSEESLHSLQSRIVKKTGIPVSIGVAETKTLAKVANMIAKKGYPQSHILPTAVCTLPQSLKEEIFKGPSCGSVWGVGRQTGIALEKRGILTISDFLETDRALIKSFLGVVGERIHLELSGIPAHQGEPDPVQKSYTSTRSFAKPVKDKLTLMSALGYHVAHVTEKLRKESRVAGKITIYATGSRFGDYAHREGSASSLLVIPSDDVFLFTKEISRLLDSIFDPEIPYKKAGVVLNDIREKDFVSQSLFTDEHGEKTRKLSSVADELNARFGSGSVRTGVVQKTHLWNERKLLKSKEYTTSWTDIACVKAM